MDSVSCSYHPNNLSIIKCERCRKPICQIDKRIYKEIHYKDGGDESYYTYHDYCILCNAIQLKSNMQNSLLIIGGICAILIFVGIFSRVGIFIFLFVLIMIAMFYFLKYAPSQQAEMEAINFKNSLNTETRDFREKTNYDIDSPLSNIKYSFDKLTGKLKPSKSLKLTCFQCGSEIEITDKFCQNCGDSTIEELKKERGIQD